MGYLRGDESREFNAEQDRQDGLYDMDTVIYKAIDDLTYNHYAHQRRLYGISAERLRPHYPLADKYEQRYQEDLKRLGRAA